MCSAQGQITPGGREAEMILPCEAEFCEGLEVKRDAIKIKHLQNDVKINFFSFIILSFWPIVKT